MQKAMGSQPQSRGQEQSAMWGHAERYCASPAPPTFCSKIPANSYSDPHTLPSPPCVPFPLLLTLICYHRKGHHQHPRPQVVGGEAFPFPDQVGPWKKGKWGIEQSPSPCQVLHKYLLIHLPQQPWHGSWCNQRYADPHTDLVTYPRLHGRQERKSGLKSTLPKLCAAQVSGAIQEIP